MNLAHNIPQSYVDSAQRDHPNATCAELFVAAPNISPFPHFIDPGRVHTNYQRTDYFRDNEFNQLAVARARTQSGNPFIRVNLHQGRRAIVSHSRATEDLPLLRYSGTQTNGFDGGDLHSCLGQLPEFALYGFAIDNNKVDLFVGSFVPLGIDPQNLGFSALLRAYPKQS